MNNVGWVLPAEHHTFDVQISNDPGASFVQGGRSGAGYEK